MDNHAILFVTAVASFFVGALLCAFAMRGRIAAAAIAAAAQGKAETQIELALFRERVRSLEEERQLALSGHEALTSQANQWREALDLARDERAQLTERASRVPILESQLEGVQEQQRVRQHEFLRLSTSEAEKTQALQSTSARLLAVEQANAALVQELDSARRTIQEIGERRATLEAEAIRVPVLEEKLAQVELLLTTTRQQASDLREASGRISAELKAEREQSEQKIALLLEAKESLTDQFKNLANEILEEKSRRFAEQNHTSLGLLLDPLKLKITEFQTKVEDVYVKEGKDRTALAEQVRQLLDLNQSLSHDAKNLTRALKGSSKTQGSWGELVLERVLEASGLRKGEEYDVQESHARDDGSRAQPDVVIHLPEGRHLVVDAKVSLTAYENLCTSENESDRQAATKRHLESIRTHVRGLSEKNYQALYGLKSLDFALMFVPIEPAFMLAVSQDRELFMDAWQRNVLLVSPSTLLFVVRTVAHLWRQEAQNRNAQEIAKRGAELYDKLVGFVEDLESLGGRLKQAQKDYDAAHNKLTGGRGNVIRQAEMLKELGIKPSKVLPAAMVEIAVDSAPLLTAE